MNFLRKILLVVITSVFVANKTFAMIPFGAAAAFPPTPPGAVLIRIGPATAAPPIDINVWDNGLPSTIADDIFPANAFNIPGAHAVNNGSLIHEMFHCFRSGGRKPHIALVRIVIIGTNGDRYVYAIPRIFVSGANHNNAIGRWNVPACLAHYPNLNNAINLPALALPAVGLPPIRPIDGIVKGIGDYGFTCQLNGQYTSFAHSERAAILCILYDANYSMNHALAAFNTAAPPGVAIAQIIIQIKISHVNGICASCRRFFNNTAGINNAHDIPNFGVFRPRFGAPVCIFGNPVAVGYTNYLVRNYLNAMGNNIPVNLRISHITAGIRSRVPVVPLASAINGF